MIYSANLFISLECSRLSVTHLSMRFQHPDILDRMSAPRRSLRWWKVMCFATAYL